MTKVGYPGRRLGQDERCRVRAGMDQGGAERQVRGHCLDGSCG